jgi:hypothetical protein
MEKNNNNKQTGKNILILILLFLLGIISIWFLNNYNRIKSYEDLKKEKEFVQTLNDSIHTYKNEKGQLVYEKAALKADFRLMKKYNDSLSTTTKRLFENFKKDKNIISSMNVQIEYLRSQLINNNGVVDTNSNSVSFKDSTETLFYKLSINNVKTIKNKKPELVIDTIKTFSSIDITTKKDSSGAIKTVITPQDSTTKVKDTDSVVEDTKPKDNNTGNTLKDKLKTGSLGVVIGIVIALILF